MKECEAVSTKGDRAPDRHDHNECPLKYARWLERLEHALRDEGYRIASGRARSLEHFDLRIENFGFVLARYRRDLAGILAARNGDRRLSAAASGDE